MRVLNILILFSITLFLASCSKNNDNPAAASANATYNVSGIVTDQNGLPVKDVKVLASSINNESEDSTFTDGSGTYVLSLKGGTDYSLWISYDKTLYLGNYVNINNLGSDKTLDFSISISKDFLIFGNVKDLEKNPIPGIKLDLIIDFDSSNVTSTSTNADGYYQFKLPPSGSFNNWQVKINSQDRRFKNYPANGGYFLNENLKVNFEEIPDYVGFWTAKGQDMGDSTFVDNDSTELSLNSSTFGNKSTVSWGDFRKNINFEYYRALLNEYAVTKSQSGNIDRITFKGYYGQQYEGIIEVIKTSPKWTLKMEVVDVNKGNKPPTVQGGFGSSNDGKDGNLHVWTFHER